jgi:2-polyprenyl-3-methyl-5-hydroxy-6-metoxy-1,4-benzoquinol methylase
LQKNYPEGIELENHPCPNDCDEGDEFVLEGRDRLHGIAGAYKVMRCIKCGLMRTNPRPTPETIGTYYPSDYGPYQGVDLTPTPSRSCIKKWLKDLLRLESKSIPPIATGRLLEIGCANGSYMEQMRNAGWMVEGIEFSESVAERARQKGFKVQTATVETAQPPTDPVDIVAAWMVLEHLHEPIKALQKMRSWVKPGGYLIASIPDSSSLELKIFKHRWYALQLPNHLYHYTPKTISQILEASGWKLTQVTWQKNCNNLLWTLEYWAKDKKRFFLMTSVQWLRNSKSAGKLRAILGWLLGVIRQSGRIEIWAQPVSKDKSIDQ